MDSNNIGSPEMLDQCAQRQDGSCHLTRNLQAMLSILLGYNRQTRAFFPASTPAYGQLRLVHISLCHAMQFSP